MIIDKTENISFYKSMLNDLDHAMAAVKALPALEEGKYSVDGGGYFMVQKGDTRPMEQGEYEAHRKFVDVQLMMEGSEEIAWADIRDLEAGEYDEAKDKLALSGPVNSCMKINAGMCWIAFPHDAHKAIRHTQTSQSYVKIVIKLPVK